MPSKVKIITFYLPQYHAIPENDLWWGKGFTDWKNVKKSKPRYFGHYQPQIPSELGYYDLTDEKSRNSQAELAKEYGITGFCYYHYWFNGKMLLEKPFDEVLQSKKPDFQFCLCWANENWTRRWDGLDSEILMEQKYEDYNAEEHINWLSNAFKDARYIKVNGRPLFLIYNVNSIPNLKERVGQWREFTKKNGFKDIYLCTVKSIHNRLTDAEAINVGFDAVVEFIPGSSSVIPRKIMGYPRYYFYKSINILLDCFKLSKYFKKLPLTIIQDYRKFALSNINRKKSPYNVFPCVIPSWDNSARKNLSASIQNNDPELFKQWLNSSIKEVSENPDDEKIVFINAWNEWAEGCHLEPDLRNGRMFLEAVKQALEMESSSN
ncbi:MAG: glycoside hydrolase family 99-like domain-containing protein [Ignavibacteria bacterium]